MQRSRKITSRNGKRFEILDSNYYKKPSWRWQISLLAVGVFLLLVAVLLARGSTTDATDRCWDDVLALLADNSVGGIDPVDLRDAIVTIAQKNEYEFAGPVVVSETVTVPVEYLGSEDNQSTTELWVDGFRWYRSATASRGYVEAGTDAITVNTAIPAGAECLFRYYEK